MKPGADADTLTLFRASRNRKGSFTGRFARCTISAAGFLYSAQDFALLVGTELPVVTAKVDQPSTRRALYCSPCRVDISAANRKSARLKNRVFTRWFGLRLTRHTTLWTASILAFTVSFEGLPVLGPHGVPVGMIVLWNCISYTCWRILLSYPTARPPTRS